MKKFDIGLVTVFNKNYGNNITNYSLYSFLKETGYSVLLVKQSMDSFWTDKAGHFQLFKNNPFDCVDINRTDKSQYYVLNDLCDAFILGSDQLWSLGFVSGTEYYTCLDWVKTSKKKIAYGTSFGVDKFEGTLTEEEKLGQLIKRFNNVFIREIEGKKYLQSQWNINSEHVCDPIFFATKDKLLRMGQNSSCDCDGKMGAYILDQSRRKELLIEAVCQQQNLREVVMIGDGMSLNKVPEDCVYEADRNAYIEDLIKVVSSCDFFVTDSFHGMCLALIFNKKFLILADEGNKRGYPRIKSLLSKIELLDRIVHNEDINYAAGISKSLIDYKKINGILDVWIDECKTKLIDAIESINSQTDEDYDIQYSNNNENLIVTNEMQLIGISNYWNKICKKLKVENKNPIPIIWGCGRALQNNGFKFRDSIGVKLVTDNNPKLWNKILFGNFYCIGPSDVNESMVIIVMVDSASMYKEIVSEMDEALQMRCVHYKDFMN